MARRLIRRGSRGGRVCRPVRVVVRVRGRRGSRGAPGRGARRRGRGRSLPGAAGSSPRSASPRSRAGRRPGGCGWRGRRSAALGGGSGARCRSRRPAPCRPARYRSRGRRGCRRPGPPASTPETPGACGGRAQQCARPTRHDQASGSARSAPASLLQLRKASSAAVASEFPRGDTQPACRCAAASARIGRAAAFLSPHRRVGAPGRAWSSDRRRERPVEPRDVGTPLARNVGSALSL